MIYLDYAATTPMSQLAMDAYRQAALRFFGNASSLHDAGSEAKRALEGGRNLIASLLNVPATGVYFTGSGSEASFTSIASIAAANHQKGKHIITTGVEHSSVRNTFDWLRSRGYTVTRVPVNREGLVEVAELKKALRNDTILVSIQYVNSETGVIQPLEEIGQLLADHPALFHSDMVQGFCKLPVDPVAWGVDCLSVSAHKVHGPKGIGAAYINPDLLWEPFIPGSVHESGFRPGTVDVPAVVAFAAAAKEAESVREANLAYVIKLKKLFLSGLAARSEAITVEGDPALTSPYVIGLRLYGMEGQYAMLECSQSGLGISTGSACQVNEQNPSVSLLAMGRTEQQAMNFIRLSLDGQTTVEEIEQAVGILTGVVDKYLKTVKL